MLRGYVTSEREAVLLVEVLDAVGRPTRVETTIDTGFDGFLTLPRSLIDELDLSLVGPAQTALGDGHEERMNLFLAAVQWDGAPREVLVLEVEAGPRIGMAMLEGCRMAMDVEEDGAVSIDSLAAIRAVN